MKYVFINPEIGYTIVTGLEKIESGIEINAFDFSNNATILNELNLVSMYAENHGRRSEIDYAYKFMCSYLPAFKTVKTEQEEIRTLLKDNCKLQILCTGDLLTKLTDALDCA